MNQFITEGKHGGEHVRYVILYISKRMYTIDRICQGGVTITNTMRITVATEYHYREPLPCN